MEFRLQVISKTNGFNNKVYVPVYVDIEYEHKTHYLTIVNTFNENHGKVCTALVINKIIVYYIV